MSEVLDSLDAEPEVINPEQEQADVPEQETDSNEVSQSEPPKEDAQEKNWRAARARMEQDARERALLKHKNDLMEQELEFLRRKSQPEVKDETEDELLTDSERRLYRELKELKEQVNQSRETSKVKEAIYTTDRLRAKYPDFDDVVSPENITYLQTHNAALARALASLKDDPYEQGLAAYDALSKTEWYQQRHTMQDKVKLEQNAKKPTSVQAVRKPGALSEANAFANGLTPELRKKLQEEMAAARKMA